MFDERVRLISQAHEDHQVLIYAYGTLCLLISEHLAGHLDETELQEQTLRTMNAVEAREKELETARLLDTERWLANRAGKPETDAAVASTPIYVSDEIATEQPKDE